MGLLRAIETHRKVGRDDINTKCKDISAFCISEFCDHLFSPCKYLGLVICFHLSLTETDLDFRSQYEEHQSSNAYH